MSSIVRALDRAVSTVSSVVQAGGVLRGQIGFERWYFHYHNKLSPSQTAKDPSIWIFCRLWAIASAIESFIKTIIVGLSIFYYAYRKNHVEIEKRVDVLYEQDNSLYYSFTAVCSPEKAVKDFSLYNEKDPAQSAIRTQWLGYSLGKYSWGTPYTGKTTVKMLINTH